MRLGSLFDGSGTAPLAAKMLGMWPIWASEIEPYPIKVTKAMLPEVEHVGSIIDLKNLKPVDIIVGGSPCQDLSVAGNRKGIKGKRSSLFYEQIRVIKEMREQTGATAPSTRCGGTGWLCPAC